MTSTRRDEVRSFIAIPVPDAGIRVLEEVVEELDSQTGGHVRWVRPEGIHLTLKFMGEIPSSTLERVLAALPPVAAGFTPFEISMSGFGVFPNRRQPRVLWAGLDGDLGTLSDLRIAIDEAVAELGLPRERRRFSPHLTLGRVRRDVPDGQLANIGRLIYRTVLPTSPSWLADTVNLMRTELDPTGSMHYLVGSASIGGG